MNKMVYLGCLALASCIGMALGYGSVMTGQKVTGYPYMANMGYGYVPYMTPTSGFGGFLGGTGSSAGGMGMFENIIQCRFQNPFNIFIFYE
jgi:hypothetical protein